MADYLTATIDLTTPVIVATPKEAFPPAHPIRTVTVLSLPAAAVGKTFLHFGANKKPVMLTQQLQRIEIVGAAEDEGVFYSCPAGVAEVIELVAGVDPSSATKRTVDVRP